MKLRQQAMKEARVAVARAWAGVKLSESDRRAEVLHAYQVRLETLQAAPPIAGAADQEYKTRIDAERVTLEFATSIRPAAPQNAIDDLPLFGGERQEDLF